MSLKELLGKRKVRNTIKGPSILGLKSADTGILAHYSNKLSYDDLINAESELGRTLFGPIPEGHQREFFEHRKNVWVWYESWTNAAGATESLTVRYEVRPTGVYKKSSTGGFERLEGAELDNFCSAVRSYFSLVKQKLYS